MFYDSVDSHTQSHTNLQNNCACKLAMQKCPKNIAELGLGFCREKLTLTTDILVDNDSRDSGMHKDLDGWSNNALFLRYYRPAIP